jgi:tetratricopeptide (TPR) repeat protein
MHRSGRRSRRWVGYGAALLAGLLAVGCGTESSAERTTLGYDSGALAGELPSELQGHLDAGNEAYRSGEFEVALAHYREAVALDPELAAGWYGVVMAEGAIGNPSGADAARAEVHRLAPELPLEHPVAIAPPNPH